MFLFIIQVSRRQFPPGRREVRKMRHASADDGGRRFSPSESYRFSSVLLRLTDSRGIRRAGRRHYIFQFPAPSASENLISSPILLGRFHFNCRTAWLVKYSHDCINSTWERRQSTRCARLQVNAPSSRAFANGAVCETRPEAECAVAFLIVQQNAQLLSSRCAHLLCMSNQPLGWKQWQAGLKTTKVQSFLIPSQDQIPLYLPLRTKGRI